MIIENAFEVEAEPALAWPLLTDVERVAPCLPGAKVSATDESHAFKGEMRVRLGPVQMTFLGELRFVEIDDEAYVARASAKAREARNRGSVDATIDFRLSPTEVGSRVEISTDLSLAGPAAQYGRAAGMIAAVAEEMVSQFAACLHDKLLRGEAGGVSRDDPAPAISGLGVAGRALLRTIKKSAKEN